MVIGRARVVILVAVVLAMASTASAYINTRPVTFCVGGTGGGGCNGSEPTLQQLLDQLFPTQGWNSTTDQQPDAVWMAQSPTVGGSIHPSLRIEWAGNANINTFGLFDAATPANTALIFTGPMAPQTLATVVWATPTSGTIQVTDLALNVLSTTPFNGISILGFGFYSGVAGNTFYTADALNPGGNPQMLALLHPGSTEWAIALEDRPWATTDRDFNDMVVTVQSLARVPEPGTMLLVGAALLGGAFFARRRYFPHA